jgi:hypothetical protein
MANLETLVFRSPLLDRRGRLESARTAHPDADRLTRRATKWTPRSTRTGSRKRGTNPRLHGPIRGLAPQHVTAACLADLEAFLGGASNSAA